MATKKIPAKRFIAIDNNDSTVIEIGTHEEVKDAIEEFANDRDLDEDEINTYIEVYEIAEKRMIDAVAKGIEVMF